MHLQTILSAQVASAKLAHGRGGTTRALASKYARCTSASTKLFIDNLSAASNGCTDSISYVWDGDGDPTPAQRAELCKCTVTPFNVPKCHWIKQSQYNVDTSEHFGFAYNCTSISGEATPVVTEVAMVTPAATTAAPETSTSCSTDQLSAFTSALAAASSGCTASSYSWGGTTNPTDAQYAEICKCTRSVFTIPSCTVLKGPDTVELSEHYKWVTKQQCASVAPPTETKKSNAAMIGGIAGGVVVVVLIIVFFLCKRNRKAKKEQYHAPHNDMNAMYAMTRSPVDYQPVGVTPPINTKGNTDPRPSGLSTATHTTISTTNGSMRPTGSSSHDSSASSRPSTTGKWDDPVITAVRIPHDTIFFGALLSRGGFGEVHRGTYKGETVAIKSLLPERRKDLALIDDFLGEVKLMSSLEHERIVKFIGVAWNSLSDACMVVEFMENGDLRSVLTRWDAGAEQRMNGFDADKVRIALHTAHALVYLHSLQPIVVHRDLKSKNILLDANFDAKLTDFGISRERADATMTAGVGSALWMAPEVMMGERYDEKADIFSFGVVLSELDTHQLPYFHAKVSESGQKVPEAAILQQVMLGRISVGFTDRALPELVELGRDCVKLSPKERPTTAQVLHRVHQVMRQYY